MLARGGGYVAYYTVRDATSGQQCISSAVASSPAGRSGDDSWGPLVCQHEHGGSIDPSPFVDADGRAYLLWKAEGYGRPAADAVVAGADGRRPRGDSAWRRHPLLSADSPFERGVVEAPSMVREGGHLRPRLRGRRLELAAVRHGLRDLRRAGRAVHEAGRRPVLASGPRLAGPGGVELFRGHDGALWAAFHAFSEPNVGYPSSRYLHVARAHVRGGRLAIDAAT